ncbi:MAG: PQQ-dependent sugar dehydrogenase [Actinomycetota bacterium]
MTRSRVFAAGIALVVALSFTGSLLAAHPAAARVRAVRAVGNLRFPTDFAFAPNNRVFAIEKNSGRILLINRAGGGRHTFFKVRGVNSSGERGMLSIALHPDYPATPLVFVYVTRRGGGDVQNQIIRLRNVDGKGRDLTKLWARRSPSSIHNGGPLAFGPDGMLYAVVGDGGSPARSQQLGDERGKVLRMTPTGAIPADNPLGNRRVFAFGIRNSFGLAFDPYSGDLWETENGPECNDELNRIAPGRNYGWGPNESCSGNAPRNTNRDGPNPVLPERWYNPTIAPTGIAFCDGCDLGVAARRAAFFGAINTGQLRRVSLTADRRNVKGQRVVFRHDGGILSVEPHPNGALYFSDTKAIFKLVRR